MGRLAKSQTLSAADDELLHELRNGLAGVHGAIQVLCEMAPDGEERQILAGIVARIERLNERLHEATCDADEDVVGLVGMRP
jgi:nitrogen-specific signal transduction histidine kinase